MDENVKQNEPPEPDSEPIFEVDKTDFSKHWKYLKNKENFTKGLLSCLGSAVICLIIWIVLMRVTGYKLGWMAITAGFAAGSSMRFFGKGISRRFGIWAGIIVLFTWLSGNFFTAAIIFSRVKNMGFLTLVSHVDFSMVAIFLKAIIGPIDILCCAAGVYTAYYIGYKKIEIDHIT